MRRRRQPELDEEAEEAAGDVAEVADEGADLATHARAHTSRSVLRRQRTTAQLSTTGRSLF